MKVILILWMVVLESNWVLSGERGGMEEGVEGVKRLIEKLSDRNGLIRHGAKRELMGMGGLVRGGLLDCIIGRNDLEQKEGCIEVLGGLGLMGRIGSAGEDLLRLLRSEEDERVQKGMIEELGRLRYRGSIGVLIGKLRSGNWAVRSESAKALGLMGAEEAVDDLMKYGINDGNSFVRIHSAGALGRIKSKRAVPYLIKALRKGYGEGRETMVWALGKIRDRRAYRILIYLFEKDMNGLVKKEAKKALSSIENSLENNE